MTNEELAVAIQAGERELLPELWQQVEKFVAMYARRRLVLSAGLGGVEFEDLYQSGYEGVSKEAIRLWQTKGLQALRKQKELQRFVEDRTPYYLRVGAGEFQRTGESAVERIVFYRERVASTYQRPKLDRDKLEERAADMGADAINAIEDPVIRVFLCLRFLHGMSWKEVADTCGKTGAAVRDACLRYLQEGLVKS